MNATPYTLAKWSYPDSVWVGATVGGVVVAGELTGKSILLVEDDRDMLNALAAVLDETGATLEMAEDGNAAVDAVASFDPDLVVLDAMLPKRSGFLVLEKLKGANKKPGIRPFIIMITGNTGKRHQMWAESLGVDGYFTKPFRMDKLVDRMKRLLCAQN
jgi:DNA-binding response OmpR family regulator